MSAITLNEVLWAALFVGILMNWSVEKWIWNTKEVIANIGFVALVWAVSQYLIAVEPVVIVWRIVYVVVACIIAFSPVEIFKAIKSGGKEGLITWFMKQKDKYSKMETTVEVKKTEITTENKDSQP